MKNVIKKMKISPLVLLLTVVCIALALCVLYNNIKLNELTIQASRKTTELEEIGGQNVTLQLKIDQKNSLANIEQIATEQLGMVKLEAYQIHTVNLAGDDSIEVIADNSAPGFLDGVVASFNILLEYLN